MHVCRPNKVGYPLKVDRGGVFFLPFHPVGREGGGLGELCCRAGL